MRNLQCTEFLQHSLPRLRFRWAGFRKVCGRVCKRLNCRIGELGLSGFSDYRDYIEEHTEEWRILDSMLQITISRFYRDRGVFDIISSQLLPSLARNVVLSGGNELACWCAGCCSGEEAYTLQILWKTRVLPALHLDMPLKIIATDINPYVLKRAREGCYAESSLGDLPGELIQQAFQQSGNFYTVKEAFRENIEFIEQDIRVHVPEGFFSLILCRNLVATYFEDALQRYILESILKKLSQGGFFVMGIHESLPDGTTGVVPYNNIPGIYEKKGQMQ